MRWIKFILLVQAVLTLVIGMVFLLESISLEKTTSAEISHAGGSVESKILEFQELGSRFNSASYILLIVASVELGIVLRLFN